MGQNDHMCNPMFGARGWQIKHPIFITQFNDFNELQRIRSNFYLNSKITINWILWDVEYTRWDSYVPCSTSILLITLIIHIFLYPLNLWYSHSSLKYVLLIHFLVLLGNYEKMSRCFNKGSNHMNRRRNGNESTGSKVMAPPMQPPLLVLP